MRKIKLAICMKDQEYQVRFVNCFMNHYKHQYELHVFTGLDQLKKSKPLDYAAIITGEYSIDEMASFVERGEILLNLMENYSGENSMEDLDNFKSIEKYQEVYKIAEQLERLVADSLNGRCYIEGIDKCHKTGIFSLTQGHFQIPFAVLLARLYGECQKVLLLDLQEYSGMQEREDVSTMGLEDLLSVATIGKYSKGRILDCVRQEPYYDYVSPVQNSQCLAEGSQELYETIMEILVSELGYERIIINFGTSFYGQLDMMEACQELYLLRGKETYANWREDCFIHELKGLEKDSILQNIKKISLPSVSNQESSWRTLVEKWSWGDLRERLEQMMEKESQHGAFV